MSKFFKVGDTVRQKSGGPVMEVLRYLQDYSDLSDKTRKKLVLCTWKGPNGEWFERAFHQNELEKYKPWIKVASDSFSNLFQSLNHLN